MNVTRSTIVGKAFILRVPGDFLTVFVIAPNMCINVKYFAGGRAILKQEKDRFSGSG